MGKFGTRSQTHMPLRSVHSASGETGFVLGLPGRPRAMGLKMSQWLRVHTAIAEDQD